MDNKPSYDELFELLDNVSASADNMFAHFKGQMSGSDRTARGNLIKMARVICDKYLRNE